MAEEIKEPLTRADVRKLIEGKGGKTAGLDLSRQVFVGAIDLSGLDLHGIILKGARFPTRAEPGQQVGARFDGSDLTGANLTDIDFEYAQFEKLNDQPTRLARVDLRGSSLLGASFQGAYLRGAKFGEVPEEEGEPAMLDSTDLRGADLVRANFRGCYFNRTRLEGAHIRGADIFHAHLEEIEWGTYKIGEENEKEGLHSAESIYRQLKQWYTNAGIYSIAGEFFFREMTTQRKRIEWWPRPPQRKRMNWWLHPRHRLWSAFHSFVSGYGERPLRVVGFGVLVLFGSALLYFILRGVAPNNLSGQAFLNSLYYSAVSFTALGYGPWFSDTSVHAWVRGAGAVEAFIGVFTIALFLVTFTRKMRR